jgi:hypothetical protein
MANSNNETGAAPATAEISGTGKRQRRQRTARRTSYKQQAEALAVENERLKQRLETAKRAAAATPGSPMESELIVDAVGGAYRDGIRTGLLLQGK